MPIQAVHVTSIEARRFSDAGDEPGQVRIDHNSTVTMVQRRDEDTATLEFRYTASYGGMGVIKLEGQADYVGDAQALEDTWNAENEMPQEIASQVHTAVMQSCVPQAVQLSRDLELPPPIPLPQIQFEGEAQQAGGESGGREVH